jgi:very-short-patch-repair endonuclease
VAGKKDLLGLLADLQGIESNLEFVFRRDVERAHGLPRGLRQARKERSRFDLYYEAYRVIVEVDGRRGHVDGRFRDFRRDNDHATRDRITLRYGGYDIRGDPCSLAVQLSSALTVRGWDEVMSRCGRCTW